MDYSLRVFEENVGENVFMISKTLEKPSFFYHLLQIPYLRVMIANSYMVSQAVASPDGHSSKRVRDLSQKCIITM